MPTEFEKARDAFTVEPSNYTAAELLAAALDAETDDLIDDDQFLDAIASVRDYLRKDRRQKIGAVDPTLPNFCFCQLPSTGKPVLVHRGESGYKAAPPELTWHQADLINTVARVTPAQREAMLAGSMFRWDCPAAFTSSYNEDGTPKTVRSKLRVR